MSTNHQISTVELTYAQVLLELADETGALEEIAEQMKQIGELIKAEPDLRRLLESKVLSTSERAEALKNIFRGRIHDLVYRFVQVVNEKDRLELTDRIVRAFANLVDKKRGLIEVNVYVASRLDADLLQNVATRIGEISNSTAVVHQDVDPALIGGLKVRVADQLIDGSVATQLRLMGKKMVAAGREKAHEQVAAMK